MVSAPFQSAFGMVMVATRFGDGHGQLVVAGVGPGHLGVGVVDIGDIVIQTDGGESSTLSDGLVGDVGDHRGIVDSGDGKGSGVVIDRVRQGRWPGR